MRLPGSIQALEQPIGLPAPLVTKSEEVREARGLSGLQQQFEKLQSQSKVDWELLRKGQDYLNKEAQEDNETRQQFKERWTRTPSSTLTRFLTEKGKDYQEKLTQADSANTAIKTKLDNYGHLVEQINMSKAELEASIPASSPATTLVLKDNNLKQLKLHLDTLNTNLRQRQDIIKRLKETSEKDDIGPKLLSAAATNPDVDEELVFKDQLALYDGEKSLIDKLIKEQAGLLESITVNLFNVELQQFVYDIPSNQ